MVFTVKNFDALTSSESPLINSVRNEKKIRQIEDVAVQGSEMYVPEENKYIF